jgi:formyl-CoA transferase
LSDLVQDALLKEDSEDWLEVFAEFDVPMNRVSTVEEAIGNEQFKVNDVIVSPADTESDSHLILNHPVKVTGVEQVGPKRAPDHGEHSEQILLGLGYSDEDIRMLREKGII